MRADIMIVTFWDQDNRKKKKKKIQDKAVERRQSNTSINSMNIYIMIMLNEPIT